MKRNQISLSRQDHFACCGSHLALARRGDELILQSYCCKDRFCEMCQTEKRGPLRSRIERRCKSAGDNVRFFTFTLRHSNTPLPDQVRRLRHSLRLLHRRAWWKEHCIGGFDCIECKPAKHGTGWHVHAHCLVQGKWIDQRQLSHVWHAITGDSSVVDVERKGTPEAMARYATKYATKALHEEVYLSPHLLDEAMIGLRGLRLTQGWGTWHDVEDEPKETLEHASPIGTIVDLVHASLAGDPGARLYLQMACCKWPHLEQTLPLDAIAALPPLPAHEADDAHPPPRNPAWNDCTEPLPF